LRIKQTQAQCKNNGYMQQKGGNTEVERQLLKARFEGISEHIQRLIA
jgi:hypothetical protein